MVSNVLNTYTINTVNQLLEYLGIEEIKPEEFKSLNCFTDYKGGKPVRTLYSIFCKEKICIVEFKNGKIFSRGWDNV